jgi:hypothetical protein
LCFNKLTPEVVADSAKILLKPLRNSPKTIFWSPTENQIWPINSVADTRCFVSATEIARRGLPPASAPTWMKVVWSPLETANDWWGLIHQYKLDPLTTFWVGDNDHFINLARTIGGRSVLITSEQGQKIIPELLAKGNLPTIAVPDWTRALEWIESI